MDKERSFLTRALLRTWHVINTSRIIFLNVLFLVLIYVLYVSFLQPPELFRLKPKTTLVIRPYGNVVEQYTTTPLDRALKQAAGQERSETRLRDILEAIHRAAGDKDIVQLVIDPNYMWGIGLAALKDIENAVDAFRSTGKPVIGLAGNLTQNQYYLVSLADEVWLNPNGVVFIDGYSNYRHFYREGLDKLAVEINLFRVGKYKSAMEPFIRDDMSPAAREAGKSWLGSLWQQYLEGVSRHRGILVESLQAAINDLPNQIEAAHGDFAQYALKLGLVDRLMTAPQARQALAQSGTRDQAGDSYRAVDMQDYLNLTKARTASGSAKHIAVIIAEGDIVNGRQPPGRIGTISIAEQLRRVARDDKVAALVLRINSPGGDAYAAQAIRQEIQQVRDAGKKVVVSMGNVAASGGYMIAMAADEVWASPATITGSIGVFGMLPTFSGTLAKIGVHTDGFGTTDIAGKIRLDRPLDPSMARVLQAATERVYRQFVAMVKKARGIDTLAEVEAVAQGRVWSGQQAADHRLVDKTGTFQDAIKAAARIAGLGNTYQLDWVEPERSALDQFFSDFVAKVVSRFGISLGQPVPVPSGWLQNMLRDLRYIASNDGSFTVAARCLCDIQ